MGNFFLKPLPKFIDSSLLKHAIAVQVNDVRLYQAPREFSINDSVRFEKALEIVRREITSNSLNDIVITWSKLNADDFEKTLCETIKEISTTGFNSGRLYTLFTFVVDVVAFKVKNGERVDVDRLLDVLYASLIDNNAFNDLYVF